VSDRPLGSEHRVDIVIGIILSIVTCGLYNIYWNYRQIKAVNALLGQEKYSFWPWLLLTLITCFIYHVYFEYCQGQDIQEYMREHGHEVSPNLAVLGVILAAFGLSVVTDALYQHELNKLT
jgi:hypothetical protein